MVTGIVLINVERSMLQQVVRDVMMVKGVSEVYSVAGEYDLVAIIRVQTHAELSEVVAYKLPRDIRGITFTKTLVALTAESKYDLSALVGK